MATIRIGPRLGLDPVRRIVRPPNAAEPGAPPPFWNLSIEEAYSAEGSSPAGLTPADASKRLLAAGANAVGGARRANDAQLLLRQFESPIVLILIFATVISGVLGDVTDAVIILAIIVLSGLLGFWQERGASRAVEALLAVVQVTAECIRGGAHVEVPVHDVMPGDVVVLKRRRRDPR